ncbi:hypothetical protein [Sphingomonas sp. HMP6]|uniref:hypothetical protein n=1 Tax=Sphingomonas sp. HMP6 TaxID=1517551 RepID=UPI0015970F79|nr:hypothetical protein [Sphingomonas sp. HMP6]BCA60212.1 hypothetical protein HMP06_2981 [Sphingomonas sp. HMP6]
MKRRTATKAPPWTNQELAILADIYPREGMAGAADALPDRGQHAIEQKAHKLGLRSPVVNEAPKLVLQGERLERAIALYEQGMAFTAIARDVRCTPTATTNAILIALCPRRGYRPGERDASGRLTEETKERLRYMLKKGLKAVDIQLRLGISAARVAEERRRYNVDLASRDKALLPPPGAGEQYSGVRLPKATRRAVEEAFLKGFGTTIVSRMTRVSKPSVKNIRRALVARLARKGEALPGCDRSGKRLGAAKYSPHHIPEASIAGLRTRLIAGEPVAHAAKAIGIGSCGAYKIRDALRAELAAEGRTLPAPIRLGRTAAQRARAAEANWLPNGRMQEFRQLVHVHGQDEAKCILIERIAQEQHAEAIAHAIERTRPKSFEEQLARIARGEVTISEKLIMRRPDPAMTLGGIATGAL